MALTWMWQANGEPLYVSLAAGSLTLSFGGRTNLSFDGEGRLIGAWFDGVTYRRALDNRVLAKWPDPQASGRRIRRFLDDAQRQITLERAYAAARRVAGGLHDGSLVTPATPPNLIAGIKQQLAAVDGWTWERLEAEKDHFATVYKPVSILPPDQYLAVVAQATEGCSYNECTFCTFYRDRPFRIKTLPVFRDHLEQVCQLLGKGMTVRKTLFLADANAVIMSQHLLLPLLDATDQMLPIMPAMLDPAQRRAWRRQHEWVLDGIYAFVSAADSAAQIGR